MKKTDLIEEFINNHQEIIQYIDSLDEKKFNYVSTGKWTAGQQLEHILLTIIPFPKVLFFKEYLIKKFGYINRTTWNYQSVLKNYLKTTLKAPDRFTPQKEITINQKAAIISDIRQILEQIKESSEDYSEKEFDTLTLPHPLLGKITIREMFYIMSYHPLHHKKQIQEMLKNNID